MSDGSEDRKTVVAAVGNIDTAILADRHAIWGTHLPRRTPQAAQPSKEIPLSIIFLHPTVVAIGYIDVPAAVGNKAFRSVLALPLSEKLSVRCELLDGAIVVVSHEEVAGGVCGDTLDISELTVLAAQGPPLLDELSIAGELLNAAFRVTAIAVLSTALPIGRVNIAVFTDRDPSYFSELSVARAVTVPYHPDRVAVGREFVECLGNPNVDIAVRIRCNTVRETDASPFLSKAAVC